MRLEQIASKTASLAPRTLLYLYQHSLSPNHSWLGKILYPYGCCRFYPSCSSYAIRALKEHGFIMAISLIIGRLARCHPWARGGFDYVPAKEQIKLKG